jgi:hypothetical protein
MCLTCGWRDAGGMLRVLENPAAVYVWLAVNLVGSGVGWVTVQPAWFIGAFVLGGIAALVLVHVKAGRVGSRSPP